MRVLVTGAEGYIGSVLCPYLSSLGFELCGLDACFYRRGDGNGSGAHRVRRIVDDIRDVAAAALPAIDAVVHLAELSNDPLGAMNPALTRDINHRGALRIAEVARRRGARRFVYASSCSVYGNYPQPRDEDLPVAPMTEYARCKTLVEADLRSWAGVDFCPVLLRFATAFGASPGQRFDVVLNDLVGRAHLEGGVTLLSDGTPWRPFVHVQDICAAIAAALAAPEERVCGRTINVGADEANITLADMARHIAAAAGGLKVVTLAQDPDARSYRVRFGLIRRLLPEFRCIWPIERGIAEMLAWIDGKALTRERFLGPEFRRLPRLLSLMDSGDLDGSLRRRNRAVRA